MRALIIDVAATAGHDGRPLVDSWVCTGSDIIFCVQNVPSSICGMAIRGVCVTITNADGVVLTNFGTALDDGWVGKFPASHFERFGSVDRGVCVRALGKFGGEDTSIVLGVGGLHIEPSAAEVQPGEPGKDYVRRGDATYKAAFVDDDGVQHYKLETLSYSEEMGDWGLSWTGDYILKGGEFVEVSE